MRTDAEYLTLQEKKTRMIEAGKHRTVETYGGKNYYVYTAEFIKLNNALQTLDSIYCAKEVWGRRKDVLDLDIIAAYLEEAKES